MKLTTTILEHKCHTATQSRFHRYKNIVISRHSTLHSQISSFLLQSMFLIYLKCHFLSISASNRSIWMLFLSNFWPTDRIWRRAKLTSFSLYCAHLSDFWNDFSPILKVCVFCFNVFLKTVKTLILNDFYPEISQLRSTVEIGTTLQV